MPNVGVIVGAVAMVVAVGVFIYESYYNQNHYRQNSYRTPPDDNDYREPQGSWDEDSTETRRRRRRIRLPEKNSCSICLEEFKDRNKNFQRLVCSHYFHESCISKWFENHNSCPNCRQLVL